MERAATYLKWVGYTPYRCLELKGKNSNPLNLPESLLIWQIWVNAYSVPCTVLGSKAVRIRTPLV